MSNKKLVKNRSMIVILSILLTATIFSVALAADEIHYLPIVFSGDVPTPTLPQSAVYIPENHTYYVDSTGYLHVIGEVRNDTEDTLREIQISADFYSQYGALLDTVTTYTYLDNLPPYTSTCFDVLLPQPVGWAYYDFDRPDYLTDGSALPALTVVDDNGTYNSIDGSYQLTGLVRNDHGVRVEYVSPIGTLYDVNNDVIGCDFTYVSSIHLEPGEISSFDIYFFGRDYYDGHHYRIQVDGVVQ